MPPRPLCLIVLLAGAVAVRADTPPADTDLGRAQQHFQRGELLKAEATFRAALPTARGTDRRLCYDRLLAIYYRLSRHDRAVQLGLEYRTWLIDGKDEVRAREVLHQIATCHLVLGHYNKAREQFREVLRDRPDLAPLSPPVHVEALAYLAQIAEKLKQDDEARKLSREAEAYALDVLGRRPAALTWAESVNVVWKLSDCYRILKKPAGAIARLEPLLAVHDAHDDAAGKCETLRMLANHRVAAGDRRAAEKDLRLALDLYAKLEHADRVNLGDLWLNLATVLEAGDQREERDEAHGCRDKAAAAYDAVVRGGKEVLPEHQPPEVAFWKLQALYQQESKYKTALQLADEQHGRWAGASLAGSRLEAEQGILHIYLGDFDRAHDLLVRAVEELQAQSTPNLIDLPRALNSLAVVEQTRNELPAAERRARQAVDLYKEYTLPDDLVLVESYGILGTCAALRGNYKDGIDLFRAGAKLCDKLGKPADRQLSNLLLNVALLHKSQGSLDDALQTCAEALAVYRRFGTEDTLPYACFLCALASLDAAQGHFAEGGAHARQLEQLCKRFNVTKGPLLLTAWHSQALDLLRDRHVAQARELWLKARAQQDAKDALLPRTLNWLALTDELDGRLDDAEKCYEEARALQETDGHEKARQAYPATYYVTLWRLAGLRERRGRTGEAHALLKQAIKIVEEGRLQTYGDAQQRAVYFAQYAPAFERLVEYSVKDGKPADAFAYSARGRSRGLLDQLQAAGIDPTTTLGGRPEAADLLAREKELRQTISRIRVQVQLLPALEANDKQVAELAVALEKAQKEYAQVYREVWNASPLSRVLDPDDRPEKLLQTLRAKVVRPGTALVAYHVGTEHSYLMLLSDRAGEPEIYELTVPAKLIDAAARVRAEPAGAALGASFKAALALPGARPLVADPTGDYGQPTWPLNRARALLLVDYHLRQIYNNLPSRDIVIVPRPERPDRAPDDTDEAIAEALLPRKVRDRLRELAAGQVVVVPDGALHKLPLESLIVEGGAAPRYVLDEVPPLVYAPSASVLARLAELPPLPAAGPSALLTVCDPSYPQEEQPGPLVRAPDVRGGILLPRRGQLPPLPGTAAESVRVRGYFAPDRVTILQGPDATEQKVRANLAGRRFVHFAVHGVVSEESPSLFAALALTPPTADRFDSADDGFLSLGEIYNLPLKECDLAVLSACKTNVGPQPPLEAGVTLATGFLSAGARNVVASHWSVADNSTAELMSAFFAEAVSPDGKPVPYAVALRHAQLKVRANKKWSSPVFWAPFVLIGMADTTIEERSPLVEEIGLPRTIGVEEVPSPEVSGGVETPAAAPLPRPAPRHPNYLLASGLLGLAGLIAVGTLAAIFMKWRQKVNRGA